MVKKAVLVGCNYPGTKAELKGCINDVTRMHECLISRYGFYPDDITVLIDTDPSYTQPTGVNIRRALSRLVQSASPGDVLFFHYSGHGTRLPAETGEDDDTGYDECIVPCDMNLITDDDFREFVDRVPQGCRLTIVSDSCHSGGLIDEAKEQIGESTKQPDQGSDSIFGFKGLLKQTVHDAFENRESTKQPDQGSDSIFGFKGLLKQTVHDAFENRGIHIPSGEHHHGQRHHSHGGNRRASGEEIDTEYSGPGRVKNRSLPLSTLIEILKQKTGKDDIDVGKLRPTLFDLFGEDASPKVKKFMKVVMNKLQGGQVGEGGSDGGFMSMVGSLAQEFIKHKLEESESHGKPEMEAKVDSKREVYAGSSKRSLPDMGILVSGCQTNETSADATPGGNTSKSYGALSNAIQTILAETDEPITNRELVRKAGEMLKKQGFTQNPGLYCSDQHCHAPFIC